ncbi:EAL domain-containing protein [Legionella jordanis]|uniref:Rtn protein n=1 Tax=Legionella jordanis TaxID=456 RepID=A0A0W0VAT4_9GAMM|nr:EAL domain-containing protein [Legionella jordanis]KTD17243.1 Rtn protein [Legionella jordanis]RMX03358.1 EAL domain-containing protein [Legionella jordanis]RMX15836.1 EAL domain-containing protein [Legionella jordanis]VEH12559.1 Rtn protein [Legionella jordanis]HAT8713366.1 EAL domain-containing protein [Legionella jordanis]
MKNKLQESSATVQQALNIIWMLLTVFFLLNALYYQWIHYKEDTHRKLESMADESRIKLDNLIESVLSTAYSLPLSELHSCEKLLPVLRNAIFSNPQISGLVISNSDNQPICSTLNQTSGLPKPFSKGPVLFGPVKLPYLTNKVFLLQQRLGQNYIGIYLIGRTIEQAFSYTSPEVLDAILYNKKTGKITLQRGQKIFFKLNDSSLHLAEAQLQNLDNFKIILVGNSKQYKDALLSHLLVAGLIILSISIFLYLQIKNILSQRFSMSYALKTALKSDRFHPAYQPIMDASENRFCAAEVLTRWFTDDDEVSPDVFIEEAEQSGLIVPITLKVLKKVFKETKSILDRYPYFHLAINLSASHFHDKHFFADFFKLCDDYQIQPRQIMLELTERQLLDQENADLMAKMHELREKGYALAIDDFGTGHASIKYLQHFPFNFLKIDKIFIHAIGTGAITESLSQAIIHMANSLKLEIIAEGVETEEQVNFLKKYQVKYMQGWYFSKAVPVDRLYEIITGVEHD